MTSPVLRLDGVSKQFNDGDETIQALAETDLSLNRGEFVGILGPSGSGKSTLLTIMGGLRTPSTGEVIIDDQPFSALPEKKRSRMRFAKLGFVLQASGLVPFLTVGDQFVLHGKVDHFPLDRARRDELLESLKIPHYVDAYPGDLSGGERQRVAMPRPCITTRRSCWPMNRRRPWTPRRPSTWPRSLLIRLIPAVNAPSW